MSSKEKEEITKRIILNLFRDTGIVYSVDLVQRVQRDLGVNIERIAQNNSYEVLKKVEETIKNLGPAVYNYSLILDENGEKILSLHSSGKYLKPWERIKKGLSTYR
jgi:hypothetical protein